MPVNFVNADVYFCYVHFVMKCNSSHVIKNIGFPATNKSSSTDIGKYIVPTFFGKQLMLFLTVQNVSLCFLVDLPKSNTMM